MTRLEKFYKEQVVQKLTDRFVEQVNVVKERKQKEIMEV